jgi:hypothetical protein
MSVQSVQRAYQAHGHAVAPPKLPVQRTIHSTVPKLHRTNQPPPPAHSAQKSKMNGHAASSSPSLSFALQPNQGLAKHSDVTLCPICDDRCTCSPDSVSIKSSFTRKKTFRENSKSSKSSVLQNFDKDELWDERDFSLAPWFSPINDVGSDQEEDAWMDAYTSSSDGTDQELKVRREEEAYLVRDMEDSDSSYELSPEAEKLLAEYHADAAAKAKIEKKSKKSKHQVPAVPFREMFAISERPFPSVHDDAAMEFDLDQSHWGTLGDLKGLQLFSDPPQPSTSRRDRRGGKKDEQVIVVEGSVDKDVVSNLLTPQVLAAISAATKPSHRYVTIADMGSYDEDDLSEDSHEPRRHHSRHLKEMMQEDWLDFIQTDYAEDGSDLLSGSDQEHVDWHRWRRIPINAFYQCRKGRRPSALMRLNQQLAACSSSNLFKKADHVFLGTMPKIVYHSVVTASTLDYAEEDNQWDMDLEPPFTDMPWWASPQQLV